MERKPGQGCIASRSGTKALGTRLRHSRHGAVPELHAGVLSVMKGAVLLAESLNCLLLENIAGSCSETRLVSRDIRFPLPIKSNTAFLFACLNL